MDVLITIGSSAAFFYSVYGWYFNLGPNFLFFETSATIITLVLLGNLLEHKSVQQTTTSIKDLSDIQKTRAKVERDNKIIEIDFEDILVGDILIVNSGDKIAVDGIVLEGNATVDESMITGESIPVAKTINNIDKNIIFLVPTGSQMEIAAKKLNMKIDKETRTTFKDTFDRLNISLSTVITTFSKSSTGASEKRIATSLVAGPESLEELPQALKTAPSKRI